MKLLVFALVVPVVTFASNVVSANVRDRRSLRTSRGVRANKAVRKAKQKHSFQSRIVGGTVAEQGEFPFFGKQLAVSQYDGCWSIILRIS